MTDQEPRSITKTDWLLIGVLVALVLPLRIWLICNTEVTARDSIGYIRFALQFEQKPWTEVLQKSEQHPGYPLLVLLTSLPVRAWCGETTPENMEFSAQLVNFFASLLLLIPTYLLGRQFFDRTVSFWGALLYQYLPISAQHLSDGISEPAYLVLLVTSLLQAVQAIRDRSVWHCALGGLCAGLAYLIRPEGALILPAFGFVLIAMQFRSASRISWTHFLCCGTAMLLAAAFVGAFYVGATGRLTPKLSANQILINLWKLVTGLFGRSETPVALAGHWMLFATSFPPIDNKALRLTRSLWALVSEINQGFHYVAGVPALLGLCWSFGSLRRDPGFWLLVVFGLLHSLILVSLAMSVYYVSDRHVMILVLLGCFFIVAGLRELPRRVLAWFNTGRSATGLRMAPLWFAVLLVVLIGACLPKATQRLHGNRAENHAAGKWLAKRIAHEENVFIGDDHAWTHFFSGLLFQEGLDKPFPKAFESNAYIVITRTRDDEVVPVRPNSKVNQDARPVWPENGDLTKARVIVYVQKRAYEEHPWREEK
jgi:hypothetical protein